MIAPTVQDIPGYIDEDDDLFELEDEDVVADDDTCTVDDFDFTNVIANMRISDVRACLETLESYRRNYIGAARRAGRRNPGAAYYHAVNTPLFRMRKILQFQTTSLSLTDANVVDAYTVAEQAHRFSQKVQAGEMDTRELVMLKSNISRIVKMLQEPGDHATKWTGANTFLTKLNKGPSEDIHILDELADDVAERACYRQDHPEGDVRDDALRFSRNQLEYVTELLILFNHGLALKYARKFTSNTSREDSSDMQAAANLGLMRAIATYDPDLGLFGSWAFKPVQRDTLKAVRDVDFANMTHGDFERRPLILRSLEKLSEADPDHTPSFEAIAQDVGCTVELVGRVLAAPHLDSIHNTVGDEGDTELGDLLPDSGPAVDDTVISQLEIDALRTYGLPMLEPKERYIIVRRFGLHGEPCEALSDIGRDLGLSRESVRQNANKALGRLLHPMVLGAIVRGGIPST